MRNSAGRRTILLGTSAFLRAFLDDKGVSYPHDSPKEMLQDLAQQFAYLPSVSQNRQVAEDEALARQAERRLHMADHLQVALDECTAREVEEAEERALEASIRAAERLAVKDAEVAMRLASKQLGEQMEEENRQLQRDEELAIRLSKRRSVTGPGASAACGLRANEEEDEKLARRLAYEEFAKQQRAKQLAEMHRDQQRVLRQMDILEPERTLDASAPAGSAAAAAATAATGTARRLPTSKEERKQQRKEKKLMAQQAKEAERDLKKKQREELAEMKRKRKLMAKGSGSSNDSLQSSPVTVLRLPPVNSMASAETGIDGNGTVTAPPARRHTSPSTLARSSGEESIYCVGEHRSIRQTGVPVLSSRAATNFFTPDTAASEIPRRRSNAVSGPRQGDSILHEAAIRVRRSCSMDDHQGEGLWQTSPLCAS